MNNKPGEFNLIHLLTMGRGINRPDVLLGVGDDTAVIEEANRCLLFTCDAQVEGTHFLIDRISPFALGQRIAAVNLSDIAAMGGRPLWALCSLFVSTRISDDSYDTMYAGLYEELGRYNVQLIGGNVARNDSGLILDLFLAGEADKQAVLYRGGAAVGDRLCVTGTLGCSAAGLAALSGTHAADERFTALVDKHLKPIARIEVGQILARNGAVTSCMDISDGLLQDAAHIATASEKDIIIDDTLIPISNATVLFAAETNMDATQLALTGGEDYELLFTIPDSALSELQQTIREETGIRITAIGHVSTPEAEAPRVRTLSLRYQHLVQTGFDHLM